MSIRLATYQDTDFVRLVYRAAFSEDEFRPVAKLAESLLNERTIPETFSFVYTEANDVVGHIAFSPVDISASTIKAYILAPLAVHPDYQHRQIGTKLIQFGLKKLSAMGIDIVFVYGDPDFYHRFGFEAALATSFVPPYPLKYPFGWQAVTINQQTTPTKKYKFSCVSALNNALLW